MCLEAAATQATTFGVTLFPARRDLFFFVLPTVVVWRFVGLAGNACGADFLERERLDCILEIAKSLNFKTRY